MITSAGESINPEKKLAWYSNFFFRQFLQSVSSIFHHWKWFFRLSSTIPATYCEFEHGNPEDRWSMLSFLSKKIKEVLVALAGYRGLSTNNIRCSTQIHFWWIEFWTKCHWQSRRVKMSKAMIENVLPIIGKAMVTRRMTMTRIRTKWDESRVMGMKVTAWNQPSREGCYGSRQIWKVTISMILKNLTTWKGVHRKFWTTFYARVRIYISMLVNCQFCLRDSSQILEISRALYQCWPQCKQTHTIRWENMKGERGIEEQIDRSDEQSPVWRPMFPEFSTCWLQTLKLSMICHSRPFCKGS